MGEDSRDDSTGEKGLGPAEKAHIEATLRTFRSQRLFPSITPEGRAIMYLMMTTPGPWTAGGIADATGLPRTTVLRRLKTGEGNGTLVHGENGWEMLPHTRRATELLVRDTVAIVLGEIKGFSDEVISFFNAIDQEEAKKISFHALPRYENSR